ncbi:type II secretion system protein [Romboutsia lituseburensis]|uniref:Type IV pilus assembly protein PilA n=1 Tax=Romboutsia lituseburensis DSM 797 TaxID=1121325 RepID=A0A1G9RMB7_9FIRM|nr:type II secretion system protein [Romboutsia lituseburensis]CEH32767.1 IV_pilin_GFxxxE: prepilin-type N-terminal cleavage/methylation domain [Romboutsia lituseburensis]SDM24408.1 type IV pilus assembly protein PilA [Romboutsia lituseburensis DSM 797]
MNKGIKENLKKKKRPGYTLVEMVLVITILGILTSLGFMKFGQIQRNAKEKADYVAASSIATAVNLAMQDEKIQDYSNIPIEKLKENKYLSKVPSPQSQKGEFSIEIKEDTVVVKVGQQVFYPKDYKEEDGSKVDTGNKDNKTN